MHKDTYIDGQVDRTRAYSFVNLFYDAVHTFRSIIYQAFVATCFSYLEYQFREPRYAGSQSRRRSRSLQG